MNVRIHRGAHEVGGTCVELEAAGDRIVLDVGLPLVPDALPMRDLLPDVPGLWAEGDGSLRAVLLSHGHLDHCGLADLVAPSVPLLAGEATARIAEAAAFFNPHGRALRPDRLLHDEVPIEIGAFTVTPVLVDHSAYDAYALVVEAAGRKLVYSGDLRAHGRKPSTIDRLARAAAGADILLLEGTRVGRPGQSNPSERDVEESVVASCAETTGLVLAAASAQNIDRLVTLFRAARRSARSFVVDLYAATVLGATGRSTIPTIGWDGLRVYVPSAQRRRVIDQAAFDRIDAVSAGRIFDEELAATPGRFLMLFRASMGRDLERADCLREASLIWSMWSGYLDRSPDLHDFIERHDIALRSAHSSGHASPEDLVRLIEGASPARVVPLHTNDPSGARALAGARGEIHDDGEWWSA